MYKIFINEIPVIIREGNKIDLIESDDDMNPLFYFTQRREIDKAFLMIQNSAQIKSLTIVGEDCKEIRKNLFADYKTIKAAGGVVFNRKDQILMIFRRNMWDLPKGKIEAGEKKKKAAVREVIEETGIQQLHLIKKLTKTYHTYVLENNTKVLKVTHWYLMISDDETMPVPQAEEGIEIVRWVDADNTGEKLKKAYANIADVVQTGISVMHHG